MKNSFLGKKKVDKYINYSIRNEAGYSNTDPADIKKDKNRTMNNVITEIK